MATSPIDVAEEVTKYLEAVTAAKRLMGAMYREAGWQERALCAQTDPESFFPEKGGSTREAKRTCSRCEVRAECLDAALERDERFGIWGGLSERDRRKLTRLQATTAQPSANDTDTDTGTHLHQEDDAA